MHPTVLAPVADAIDETAPTIDGYQDLTLLGFGGFSRVWTARDSSSGRKVAAKVSIAHKDPRFSREADSMRKLGPKLCPELLAEGTTADGHPFIVMELLDGRPLSDWLAECSEAHPPLVEASRLFAKLCTLVDSVHAHDVLHRDLKPENTMLLADGTIRVLDLGLARSISQLDTDLELPEDHLTQTGSMLGTVTYIAPEQSLGKSNLTERSDIYSLAVMAFELVTGRTPFVGSRSSIVQAHSWQKPPLASELAPVSTQVDQVLLRGLAKDPALRWSTATELALALVASISELAPAVETGIAISKKSASQTMALLWVQGDVPVSVVQKSAGRVGGQLARTTIDGFVIVFATASHLDLGVDAAIALALELSAQADTCVVHVAKIRARSSRRGTILVGDAIKQSELWAKPYAGGLHATPAAVGLLTPAQLAGYRKDGSELLASISSDIPTNTESVVDWGKYRIQIQAWGRDSLIRQVESEARESFDSSVGGLTTVIGDVGYGKTHLAGYLRVQAKEWKRVRLISLRAGVDGEDRGDALLRRLVREAFGLFGANVCVGDVKQACQELLGTSMMTEAWPVVSRSLDLMNEEEFSQRSSLVGPTAARQALARAIAQALAVSAQTTPIALVLDDAHRADFTTLDALELATLAERGVPLWVLAVAGPTLDELRPNWGARATLSTRHILEPLGESDSRGMLMQLLHPVEYVPESIVSTLIGLTQGVPLYLEEVATALKHNGAVRIREGTESFFVSADELVAASKTSLGERLARSALGGMREDLGLFAQLCAVIGPGVNEPRIDEIQRELEPGLGFSSLDPDAGLRHLVERRMLRRSSRGLYEFRSPMIREATEALIPIALRRVLHAACFRTLDLQSDSPLLVARHAASCGESLVAAEKYMQVAALAESRFRYVESQQAYSKVLANIEEGDSLQRMRALSGRSRVNNCVGRHDDALVDLGGAMKVAENSDNEHAQVEMLLERATILDWKFLFSESAVAGRSASLLVNNLGDAVLENRCLLAIARSTCRQGNRAEAIGQLQRVEEESRRLEDYPSRVIAMALLGGALAAEGQLEEAETCLDAMISMCHEVGDRFHLAVAHANRMHVWIVRHDYERAVADARDALEFAQEIAAFPIIWVSQNSLAYVLMWLGRYDEALIVAVKARDIQHRCSSEPDPADTLLIARIKIASDGLHGSVVEELEYLNGHHSLTELSPVYQLHVQMVQLWHQEGSAEDWDTLLQKAENTLELDERLEFLLAYARAAKRGGRSQDVVRATTLAHEVATSDSVWMPHFDSLKEMRMM